MSLLPLQVAQPDPVAADPGDAGSHGGEVEEEGGAGAATRARTGEDIREFRKVTLGK